MLTDFCLFLLLSLLSLSTYIHKMMEAELVPCLVLWLSLLTVAIMTPYDKAVQVVSHRGAAGYIPTFTSNSSNCH